MTHKHTRTARLFHWGFLGLFAYGIAKGLDSVHQLADPATLQFEMLFAALFLAVLGARFLYMRRTRPTALPEDTHPWMKRAARWGHLALYGSLAMIAISGMAIGGLYAGGVTGGAVLGMVVELHEAVLGLSYLLIGGHIAAALYHRLLGDGVWSAMVPLWTEKAQ